MTKEKSTVPRLRFPGFTDAWKQRKLGEVVSISSGYTGDASLSNGKYKLTRIETISDGNVDVSRTGFSNELPDEKYRLKFGDILFSNINSLAHIGKVAIFNIGEEVFHGINLLRLVPKQDLINPYFIYYQLVTESKKNWSKSHANQAVNQASINQTSLSIQKISLPTLPEQEAIGSFFSDLDQLITLHQRKLDDVKELKKALLQKMFPKGNGNDFPELRFPEFTDAWKQRKLGEVATFAKGNGYSKKDLVIEGSPIILYGRLYTKYETVISEVDTFVSVEDNNNSVVYSEGGEVLVPASGESSLDIARASVVAKKGIILGGDINIIRLHSEIFPVFLALTISNGKQQKGLSKRAQGKSVVHLHNSDLKKVDLDFPSLPEQEAIGSFFSDLDQLITLHQRQLDHLKLLKKALLQQMFI
ncbi:restriction endonuclease subunit S [Streptococcus suis]|uniref:restriction endonuclease subunit S n=1 Tax=Streptococcus suis TaxID=1307 RepID=UPI00040267FC|nr:restriction endonuclease subunit S [Streptococcus suis]